MTAATSAPAGWRDLVARLPAATVIGIITGLVVLGLEHLVEDRRPLTGGATLLDRPLAR
jgi:hypothetical protein